MKSQNKIYEDMSIEDALASIIDPFRRGELSLQQCLERFPQHHDELTELLDKFTILLSNPIVSPRLVFQRTGYQQVMSRLADPQSVSPMQGNRKGKIARNPAPRLRFSMANIIIAFIFAFTAISGGVAYAANAAEPGDFLFGLDQKIEQVRLDLARDTEAVANLRLSFAVERLEESQNRLDQGDFENADIALQSYTSQIASLAQLVGDAQGEDKEALAELLDATREIHLNKLNEVFAKLPQQAQDNVQNVIDSTSMLFDGPGEPSEEPEELIEPGILEQEGKEQNPVALYLAGILEVKYDDIIALQQQEGYGLGNISKAYYVSTVVEEGQLEGFDGDISMILEEATGMGWGNYYRSLNLYSGGNGLGWMFREYNSENKPGQDKPEWVTTGPPDHANNDKDKEKNPNANENADKDKDKDKDKTK